MLRQRMTSLDIRASVEEMRAELVGLRLINLYDIQAKTFLFRFGDSASKRTVLLENGVRMHLTTLERERPMVPSQFTLKLRKHIRAWRLDAITQFEQDRTIDMCFGTAGTEGCFHIIVELFSKGNVILTDHAYTIMMLLRTHKDDDVSIRVREVYPVTPPLSVAMAASAATPEAERVAVLRSDWEAVTTRKDDTTTLKLMVAGVKYFGPTLAEHIAARTVDRLAQQKAEGSSSSSPSPSPLAAGLLSDMMRLLTPAKLNTKRKDIPVPFDELFEAMLPAMLEAWDLTLRELPKGGYLLKVDKAGKGKAGEGGRGGEGSHTAQAHPSVDAPATTGTHVIVSAERFDDFTPLVLAQHESAERAGTLTKVFLPSFGSVCDKYFLFTETQSIAKHNEKQKKTVLSKREKFERDFQRRVSALEQEQAISQTKGELLILHADRVDEALGLINGALAAGIQWDALRDLLRRRHADGHPVAYMIHELFLERNAMSVLLERELYDDEDDADITPMTVEVSLGKTAHANAAEYFMRKKAHQAKLGKTLASQEKAAAGAARKGERLAAKKEVKKQILVTRTREWWEKYTWFITSAGDFVVQGKDTQTTELLVRRLLRLGDMIVHCDVDGALPCFVRPLGGLWAASPVEDGSAEGSGTTSESIPPVAQVSLEEAGAFCVSRSTAYDRKSPSGAWWVYASQLTGGSAAGAYLYTGEKHHLPPRSLQVGCGLLCRVVRDVRVCAAAEADAAGEGEEVGEPPLSLRCPPWPRYLPRTVLEAEGRTDTVPPDPAPELQELPSVEAIRPARVRPPASTPAHPSVTARTTAAVGSVAAPTTPAATVSLQEGARPTARKTTRREEKGAKGVSRSQLKKEKLAARSARIAMEQAFVAAELQDDPASASDAEHDGGGGGGGRCLRDGSDAIVAKAAAMKGTFDAKKPPPPPQLSKHQRKKLEKIKAKYADQDDEDRERGAMLNGNQISRIQARHLAEAAERARVAEAEALAEAKAQRARDRKAGRLRYLSEAEALAAAAANGSSSSSSHGTDDSDKDNAEGGEEEDVEVVDEFTDEEAGEEVGPPPADGEGTATAAHIDPVAEGGLASTQGRDASGEDAADADDAANESTSAEVEVEVEGVSATRPAKARATTNRDAAHVAAASDAELRAAVCHYTPFPAATDTVVHVVPVCAPLSVVASYPYHVELGLSVGAKKSQVAQHTVEIFRARALGVPGPGESSGPGRRAGEAEARRQARQALESSTLSSATTTATARTGSGVVTWSMEATKHASVLKALETLDLGEVVEQLRGSAAVVSAAKGRR